MLSAQKAKKELVSKGRASAAALTGGGNQSVATGASTGASVVGSGTMAVAWERAYWKDMTPLLWSEERLRYRICTALDKDLQRDFGAPVSLVSGGAFSISVAYISVGDFPKRCVAGRAQPKNHRELGFSLIWQ